MHNHFDQHLNLKRWILDRRPKLIIECGAGTGELTQKLASLLDVYPFELVVISDSVVQGLDKRIRWFEGLSYEVLKGFPKDCIGLCIIDTDHNFWTLMKEFEALIPRMADRGLIALHDVETFYHNTGMAMSYSSGEPYPKDEIMRHAAYGSLGDAMIEFLQYQKLFYKLLAYNNESQGAALIEKYPQAVFSLVTPGPGAIYSKKEKEHASV